MMLFLKENGYVLQTTVFVSATRFQSIIKQLHAV